MVFAANFWDIAGYALNNASKLAPDDLEEYVLEEFQANLSAVLSAIGVRPMRLGCHPCMFRPRQYWRIPLVNAPWHNGCEHADLVIYIYACASPFSYNLRLHLGFFFLGLNRILRHQVGPLQPTAWCALRHLVCLDACCIGHQCCPADTAMPSPALQVPSKGVPQSEHTTAIRHAPPCSPLRAWRRGRCASPVQGMWGGCLPQGLVGHATVKVFRSNAWVEPADCSGSGAQKDFLGKRSHTAQLNAAARHTAMAHNWEVVDMEPMVAKFGHTSRYLRDFIHPQTFLNVEIFNIYLNLLRDHGRLELGRDHHHLAFHGQS